jgi:hypothetical protein
VRDRAKARGARLAPAHQGRGLSRWHATITQRKLRALQRKAGDTGPRISLAGETKRKTLERRFLEEAERNYRHYVADKHARRGAGAATGDATLKALEGQTMRGRPKSPTCSSRSGSPAPKEMIAPNP